MAQHILSVPRVLERLDRDSFAVVGHDSGGMIARHAVAGHPRLRAMGLINTERPQGLSWRFKLFLMPRSLPGFGALLGWAIGQRWLRRNPLLLGDAFTDRSLIDGDFDELFLKPIHTDPARRAAAVKLLRNFDDKHVTTLSSIHQQLHVPVQLVWGAKDPFFPLNAAREMVDTFPNAHLHVIDNAKLFSHEEFPQEVAEALLPTLLGGGEDRSALLK